MNQTKTMNPLKALCNATSTKPKHWEELDGPDSRCGTDHYYRHAKTGQDAHVNDDQGHYTIDLGGDDE